MTSFVLNGELTTVEADADTPILWVLREHLDKMGTKFGCGAGLCGACTVLLDGKATRSCLLPLSSVGGCDVNSRVSVAYGELFAIDIWTLRIPS